MGAYEDPRQEPVAVRMELFPSTIQFLQETHATQLVSSALAFVFCTVTIVPQWDPEREHASESFGHREAAQIEGIRIISHCSIHQSKKAEDKLP